jgi:hypothetical protein
MSKVCLQFPIDNDVILEVRTTHVRWCCAVALWCEWRRWRWYTWTCTFCGWGGCGSMEAAAWRTVLSLFYYPDTPSNAHAPTSCLALLRVPRLLSVICGGAAVADWGAPCAGTCWDVLGRAACAACTACAAAAAAAAALLRLLPPPPPPPLLLLRMKTARSGASSSTACTPAKPLRSRFSRASRASPRASRTVRCRRLASSCGGITWWSVCLSV